MISETCAHSFIAVTYVVVSAECRILDQILFVFFRFTTLWAIPTE